MTYTASLWLYLVLLFGIIIVPGMDMLFVIANSLTGGRRAGMAAVAGIVLGGAVHTFVGTLAVAVLTNLAPSVFAPMVLVGAAYMAWIGVTLLRSSITIDDVGSAKTRSLWVAFRQGAVTCLLNPKAYLFTMSVYPQFLKPQYGPIWSQALVMGVLTAIMQVSIYGGLAIASGRSRDFLISSPGATILAGRICGALFIAAACVTAWHGLPAGAI